MYMWVSVWRAVYTESSWSQRHTGFFCSFLAVTWWRNASYCIALPHVPFNSPRNRTRALLCSLFWAIIIHFANFCGISCCVWIFPKGNYLHRLRCSYGGSERVRCPIPVEQCFWNFVRTRPGKFFFLIYLYSN